MFETDYDMLLDFIYVNKPLDFRQISGHVKTYSGRVMDDDILDIALSVLINDGYIMSGHPTIMPGLNNQTVRFTITPKGKHFKVTSSYVQERQKNEYEALIKKKEIKKLSQEIALNDFQIKTKGWAFWISAISLVISIAAFLFSLLKQD